MFTTTVFAGDTNSFWPVIPTHNPPLIESSKASCITNGITLGQVVTNLGPGWWPDGNGIDSPIESAGIIRWTFADGRQLNVRPTSSYSASMVLGANIGQTRFWFTTNAYIVSPK